MLGFHLFAYDEDFDFAGDDLPDSLYFPFGDQLARARAILARRDNAQIWYAVESLDWMLRKGDELLFHDVMQDPSERGRFINRVKALQALMREVDLSEQASFPGATWHEYFALLALAFIAEELYAFKYPERPLAEPDSMAASPNGEQVKIRYEAAIEAMEAVCLAESLQREEALRRELAPLRGSVEARIAKERGAKGGKVRAARFDELRNKAIAAYKARHERHSNRQAARRIWNQELDDTDKAVLSGEEPWHTLERWIAAYKKHGA